MVKKVKKKVRSKSLKKVVKKPAKVKGRNKIKKEFDVFAGKIAKLESLKNELNALNTKGFDADVKLIRAKLRNVDSIPEVVRKMNVLKSKIKKKASSREISKKKSKLFEENMEKEHNEIKKKISNLSRRKLSREEIEYVRDIPLLEGELNILKEKADSNVNSSAFRKRIKELKELIAKKKSAKRRLSREEIKSIKGIPNLSRVLRKLHRDFIKHTKFSKKKVDAGVGVLVDTNFHDFISQIKGELTERLKVKEAMMSNRVRMNINSLERDFANKYRKLSKEFHDKYEERIKSELKSEIRKRFDKELNEKLMVEKKKIINNLIKENIKQLASERKTMIDEMHAEYASKVDEVKEKEKKHDDANDMKFKKKVEGLKVKMQKEVAFRIGELTKEKEREVKRKLESEKKALEREYRNKFNLKMSKKKEEMNRKKEALEKHVIEQAQKLFRN